jgi:hypothetical protein
MLLHLADLECVILCAHGIRLHVNLGQERTSNGEFMAFSHPRCTHLGANFTAFYAIASPRDEQPI